MVTGDLTTSLAEAVQAARTAQGLSASALAERSGVSRAMIAKVERAEAQPTAALLGRLSAALGMTLSELVARAEHADRRLVRAAEQPTWTDPDSGYTRRARVAAAARWSSSRSSCPAGAEVSYPADTYAFIHQQIWVLDGRLRFREGDAVHDLDAGDCLQLGPPAPCTFSNPTRASVPLPRRADAPQRVGGVPQRGGDLVLAPERHPPAAARRRQQRPRAVVVPCRQPLAARAARARAGAAATTPQAIRPPRATR